MRVMTKTLPRRAELPREQTWNLESLFASEADWNAALEAASTSANQLEPFMGKLGSSAAVLRQALETRDQLLLNASKVSMYASLNAATDGGNANFSSMLSQARGVFARVASAGAFIEPEVLSLDPAQLEAFMTEDARLAVYRHAFEVLMRRKPHVRSAEVEALMAQASDPLGAASTAATAATGADMTFKPVMHDSESLPVTHTSVGEWLVHPEADVRQQAWESYADGHNAFRHTLAATLQGSIKAYVFGTRARHHRSSLDRSLSDNHIPRSVFDHLLATFQANLPTWHRFWAIRRKRLGELRTADVPIYDAPAPLVPSPKVTFRDAAQMILHGMEPLGTEYTEPMRQGLFEDRWVDWGQNDGKRAGAFSSGLKGTFPFIFMSWSDDLFSMSTLAHELGHSMHSYFTRRTQPIVYARYSLFIAEVASNFNQALVRARLLRDVKNPAFRLAVLEEAFSNFHRYLFVMPTLARFEQELYERIESGGAITAPYLGDRLADLFTEGYGGHVTIDRERLGSGWMNFSHLYAPFYVYQYATGIAAANALAQDVMQEGEPAAKRYLDFLKVGDSVDPIDALKIAGIDMTRPEPVERGFEVLKKMVDELETLLS
jgi:oligoendopeptidase F